MLFKLTNMSAIFQELINHVLYNHLNKFIIVYLNDILIYSENEKNKKIIDEIRKNQSNNRISNIKMYQKYSSISRIDRILLKIHHRFCQHYCITHQLIMKRQIIQVNRITRTSIQRNKKKFKKKS